MKKKMFKAAFVIVGLSSVSMAFMTDPKVPAIDNNNFDKTTKPTENFFQYVNGNWVKNNPIPPSESRWDVFSELYDKNFKRLKSILEEASADKTAKPGSNTQKIRDFYSLGMDSIKLNKDGLTPVLPELAAIDKIATTDDLLKEVAHLHTIGVGAVFGLTIDQDQKISTQYITQLYQGGIGLGDKDYYTNTDERTLDIQKSYVQHIENMFKLLGDKPEVAKANAKSVYDLETKLAKASMNQIQLRDPEPQYNKKTLAELQQLTPDLNWSTYLTAANIKGVDKVIVGQPDFFVELNKDLKEVSIADWKTYLRWSFITAAGSYLSDDFVTERFQFFSKKLNGIPAMRPRWKRVLRSTDASLGDALGQLYVKKYFTEDSKKRINAMVDNLIAAYRVRIASRDWMSEETKKQAYLKLDKLVRKMGYPDRWKDYATLDIKNDSYVQNIFRASAYEFNQNISRIGKPIDRAFWFITPPTINAFYGPTINEIVFPAGIMQPVFFNPDADDAVNYGSMGAVIGHELTHGFDDQGAQFDSDGNLKNWWTKEDLERFKARTEKLAKQFDDYVAIDDIHVKGELTLGENIADLGGLTIAYYAYKKSLEGKPAPAKIDGFTGEQRFFIAWAQAWRTNVRPEFLKNIIQTDPHAPSNIRANAAPSNMQEFYDAFGVKEGDKMYRKKEDRVEIW
ncbi:MAG TPA: M13 family metallopeptidase [Bacteroidia bacterium]|nr:M13 family metallopeptidase [Bacteroidia bacterium]HRG53221.1 M13 family metallopeptidase [Bacteroidia bacterium]